ncbi:MAG: hypothetical protein Q9168_003584 [Polycauliona sp. 1 TL-2023]
MTLRARKDALKRHDWRTNASSTEELAKLHQSRGQLCQAELVLEEHLVSISRSRAQGIWIAIRPDIVKRLCELYRLFKERVQSVPSVFALNEYTLIPSAILHRLARIDCDELSAQVVEALLTDGTNDEDANFRESIFFNVLLHFAARYDAPNLASYALDHGADVDIDLDDDSYGDWTERILDINGTPLHIAVACNSVDVVKLLIEKGADVNKEDFVGTKPLHAAMGTRSRDMSIIVALLLAGADTEAGDWDKETSLMIAARNSRGLDLLRLLLNFGATVHSTDYKGRTVLHYVAQSCSESEARKIIDFLLSRGLEIDVRDTDSRTALHHASLRFKPTLVEHLLKNGASIFAESQAGTPLHEAVDLRTFTHDQQSRRLETIEMLIRCGADTNRQRRSDGKTPLHLAVILATRESSDLDRKRKLLRALCTHGADVDIRDNDGKTPLDHASDIEITQILMEYPNPRSLASLPIQGQDNM